MMIKVKQYIDSGFSSEDAQKLSAVIEQEIKNGDCLKIDFSGVKFFTTLFFNQAITKYLDTMTKEEFDQKIHLLNLSKVGEATYRHSYDYAIEYYAMPQQQRRDFEKIIEESTEGS